jgi:ABC-type transport system involved in Fe-S cluster assembly fused permease/ATPase subunit
VQGAKATDALLNYETVKLFNNEALERRNFAEVCVLLSGRDGLLMVWW